MDTKKKRRIIKKTVEAADEPVMEVDYVNLTTNTPGSDDTDGPEVFEAVEGEVNSGEDPAEEDGDVAIADGSTAPDVDQSSSYAKMKVAELKALVEDMSIKSPEKNAGSIEAIELEIAAREASWATMNVSLQNGAEVFGPDSTDAPKDDGDVAIADGSTATDVDQSSPYAKMKIIELQAIAEDMGIDPSANKDDLVAAVELEIATRQATQATPQVLVPDSTDAPEDDGNVLADESTTPDVAQGSPYAKMKIIELQAIAKDMGIKSSAKKSDLVAAIELEIATRQVAQAAMHVPPQDGASEAPVSVRVQRIRDSQN